MNKKTLYIIAIAIIIVLIGGIIYFFYGDKFSFLQSGTKAIIGLVKKDNTQTTQTEVKKIDANSGDQVKKPVEPTPPEPTKDQVARLAVDFAERFGSYSNQANFKNVSDLKIFMTETMKSWADNYLAEQRRNASSTAVYYGISTKAVAKELLDFDDNSNRVTVLVHTRRQEANGTTANVSKVFSQDIKIDLVKLGETWKIDKAIWQNK